MSNLNGHVIKMSISNAAGETVAENSIMFEDLEGFRKKTGSSGTMLLEQMLNALTANAGAVAEPDKVLPTRRPGQENFNR